MKANPYTDAILGNYSYDKKRTTKDKFWYTRTKTLKLDMIHAQNYIDPETKKKQKVWGLVTLTQHKLVDRQTSEASIFCELAKTPESLCENEII